MKFRFTAAQILTMTVVLLAAAIGYRTTLSSYEGAVYVSNSKFMRVRNPATTLRHLDFSRLSGPEFLYASQKQLVTSARVILQNDLMGVELGHFFGRDEISGDTKPACEIYERVVLFFEGEGIAEGGDKAELMVEGPCVVANDVSRIEPLWLPVLRLLKITNFSEPVRYSDYSNVTYSFTNMTSQWPMRWVLQSVRLIDENSQEQEGVFISDQDMRTLLSQPIVLNWGMLTN